MTCYICSGTNHDFENDYVLTYCAAHAEALSQYRTVTVDSLPEKDVKLIIEIIEFLELLCALGDEYSSYVLQTLIDLKNSFENFYGQKNVSKMFSCCNMILDFLKCVELDSNQENQNLIEEIISTIQELMLELILIP